MKKLLLLTMLTGCAGVGQFQASCYQQHKKFKDAYSCINTQMTQDYRFSQPQYAGLVSEYQITAEVLQEKVNKGKMTDAEAKLALAKKRAELSSRERGYNTVSSSANTGY